MAFHSYMGILQTMYKYLNLTKYQSPLRNVSYIGTTLTHTHTHTHTHPHTHTHKLSVSISHTHTCMHMCTCDHMHACTHTHTHSFKYISNSPLNIYQTLSLSFSVYIYSTLTTCHTSPEVGISRHALTP